MQPSFVHYIPVITTILAVPFTLEVYRRFRAHPDRLHLLWWAIGIATYGARPVQLKGLDLPVNEAGEEAAPLDDPPGG